MTLHFEHRQAAHCESGVISSMLTHHGLPISEPMAFGLSGALAFAYLPFIKLSGMPLIAYRLPPKKIIKGLQKRLGIKMRFDTYRNPNDGMLALDRHLDEGRIVGLQTSVFWLPYFPDQMRFHFNAHNLIAFKRENNSYLVSDPVFETTQSCEIAALQKSRFAKGALAAKGLAYYPTHIPSEIDYPNAVKDAIKSNYRIMNGAPLPIIGIRGIRYLAKNIVERHKKGELKHLRLYLTHIVRMQEEIGTGGAGFRFIYASFLNECAGILNSDLLKEASSRMTAAGDEWRLFALQAAKMCRNKNEMDSALIAQTLNSCADKEQYCWRLLKEFTKTA